MKEIINKSFGEERALYGLQDTHLSSCSFLGVEDGESALKECDNLVIDNTLFALRYPLWHNTNLVMTDCKMLSTCRASLWYVNGVSITSSSLLGIKAIRECNNVDIKDSIIDSPEFGWKSKDIKISNTSITSEYLFFDSSSIDITLLTFKGKYSFQYVKNMIIKDSILDTKDAFWHSENVTVINSTIKGEYLAWYSTNLTLINCIITGTQPFCYCKGLVLKDCTMEGCDLAFEYSEVEATTRGKIKSIKNPLKGNIKIEEAEEVLFTSDSRYKCLGTITKY